MFSRVLGGNRTASDSDASTEAMEDGAAGSVRLTEVTEGGRAPAAPERRTTRALRLVLPPTELLARLGADVADSGLVRAKLKYAVLAGVVQALARQLELNARSNNPT